MSQNKTVIQGIEEVGNNTTYVPGENDFYKRGAADPRRGTVVPGMMTQSKSSNVPVPEPERPVSTPSGKPVVGFLYSVSRTAVGEFWPLQIGQNTIGSDPGCDICLPEGTVSAEHAVLVVRKMKKPEMVIASISDARSTNGTMLNGESLAFSAVECKNGDIITIGDNYELYLVLIDTAKLNLKVSENFIRLEMDDEDDAVELDDVPPFTPPYPGQQGTVGLDGGFTGGTPGGTVGM